MKQNTTTRERLIEAGQQLMLERSFHSVGLTELLSAVNVPKGSFYHHFESKEQFGVVLLEDYVNKANANRRQMLLNQAVEPNPLLRLYSYSEGITAKFMSCGGHCPCLVVKLASEVCGLSDPMREVLRKGAVETRSIYQQVLAEAQAKALIRKSLDVVLLASIITDLWTAAVQRCTIEQCVQPLRDTLTFLKSHLEPV